MEAVKHWLKGVCDGGGGHGRGCPQSLKRFLMFQDTLKRDHKFPNGSLFAFVVSYLIFPSGSNPSNGGFWPG